MFAVDHRLCSSIILWLALPHVLLAERSIDFRRDIRPILSDKCFQCHGPDEQSREADLRLDHEESAKGNRDGYQVIHPGKPQLSELVKRIISEDVDERMPPPDAGKPISAEKLELLQEWIRQGAPWSQHWAYVAPSRSSLPEVQDRLWPRTWIDHYVLAGLEDRQWRPAPSADSVTLLRRLYFDLTGTPPPRDAREPKGEDAYVRLVDELLASPAFGERMAVYWLDLVRYADTVGYHGDQDHSISPYRDYVVEAFNENMPFDRFTREQLAGDLLPDATIDQQIASGYNRLLQTSHEGGVQPKEYLAIYAADRVRNVSAIWLGGTLGCAQCHDHKYDPFTTGDFYSMVAFFADLDESGHFKQGTNQLPTLRPPELRVLSRRDRRTLEIWKARREAFSGGENDPEAIRLDELIEQLESKKRKTMVSASVEPRVIRVLPRGNWLDESGPVVEPAVPEFLGDVKASSRRASRLDLARWLVDTEHGSGLLTARVFVNRLWYLFYGRGLASRLDDFGGQGDPPTHPQLLDRLAFELVDRGWDLKAVIRQMLMSATYRQSSLADRQKLTQDPTNQWFARQSRWRLPAEMVRDTLLSVSGLLVHELGGPSVKPYQPAGYYQHLNFPTRTYQPHTDKRQWRKGLYVHWQRQFLHPMLKAFDAPSREECTAERPRSNTPLAALTLLNDPTCIEAARSFAMRIMAEGGDNFEQRIAYAFRSAFSRDPDQTERQIMRKAWTDQYAIVEGNAGVTEGLLAVGLTAQRSPSEVRKLATWTLLARTMLNTNEFLMRN